MSTSTVSVERARLQKRSAVERWGPLLRYGSFALALLAWEIAGWTGERLLIPPFSATVAALWKMTLSGELLTALATSNQSLVIGFAITVLLGIPAGLVLGRFPLLDRASSLYLDISLVLPMVALMPVVIAALGITLTARVVIVVLFAVPGLIVNVRTGMRGVDPRLVEMARAFGAREWEIWLKVTLPAALPALMAGLRYAASRAVVGMIIVELTLISVGVGLIIQAGRGSFQPEIVFAATIVIAAEGMLIVSLARRFERVIANPRRAPKAAR
ncbi:MAG: ABC transporter permease [Chloroflexi bacterium]|nr:ABC transporter permease [Chloroflexota bacterium]